MVGTRVGRLVRCRKFEPGYAVMAGLHLWKLERERNRGIVRFPRYPSPE